MYFKYYSIIILTFSTLIFFSNCANNHSKDSNKKNTILMSDSTHETRNIKVNETFEIKLEARGALGLKPMYKMSNDNIVVIKRQKNNEENSNDTIIGGAINIIYEIMGIAEGSVIVTFYETQPWNKDFKEIVQKEMIINVSK